jgi:hypothetical protein
MEARSCFVTLLLICCSTLRFFFINCHVTPPRSSSHRLADVSNMIVYSALHRWRGVTRMVEMTDSLQSTPAARCGTVAQRVVCANTSCSRAPSGLASEVRGLNLSGGNKISLVRRRKNKLDAVKLMFIDVSHSACFRHLYAHHQEYKKGRQTAYGVLHWSCRLDLRRWGGLYLMAVVIRVTTAIKCTQNPSHLLKSTTAQPSSAHGIHLISSSPLLHSHQVHTRSTSSPQVQSARPVQNTVCSLSSLLVLLMMGIIIPETCWVTNINKLSGFGGLEDACWPLVPKFVGSNPAEAFGFFRAKKSPARLPLEGE